MARIVGGIGVSHSPQIGFAKDTQAPDSAGWSQIFDIFAPLTDWLETHDPDVLLYVYNDHVTSFFFDHYSPFVLGVDDEYVTADEGGGARVHPPIRGHAELARHIGTSLFAEHFDISFFQHKPVDHGMFSPLSMMTDRGRRWAGSVVPLQVGVLQFPIPTARRCWELGGALRRAIESYDDDISVAVVSSGGLSHQVHGERAGFNNVAWDARFLDLLEHDPDALAAMTHAEYAALGGVEGAEVIMWLIMRGGLSEQVRCVHRATCLPSMTHLASVVYEGMSEPDAARVEAHRELVSRQLAGIDDIEGTYPFTLERSRSAYRLNDFLHRMVIAEHRQAFLRNPEEVYEECHLSAEERRLVDSRDWIGMIRYGAIFFGLEKLASVLGLSNADIYAQMRGESLEQFQQSRNTALRYSVAGGDAAHDLAASQEHPGA